jgi:hypothetical protein
VLFSVPVARLILASAEQLSLFAEYRSLPDSGIQKGVDDVNIHGYKVK